MEICAGAAVNVLLILQGPTILPITVLGFFSTPPSIARRVSL